MRRKIIALLMMLAITASAATIIAADSEERVNRVVTKIKSDKLKPCQNTRT